MEESPLNQFCMAMVCIKYHKLYFGLQNCYAAQMIRWWYASPTDSCHLVEQLHGNFSKLRRRIQHLYSTVFVNNLG